MLKKCIQDYQSKLKVAEDKLQDFIQEAEVKIEEWVTIKIKGVQQDL